MTMVKALNDALRLGVVDESRAFVLDRSQAEAGNLNVFLVSLLGGLLIEEIRIFLGVLVVLAPEPVMFSVGR